jgi:hypothetical protein
MPSATTFMTDSIAQTKILVDTNILIYATDLQAGDKNLKAVELVDELTAQNRMVVSAQVLNEIYRAAAERSSSTRCAYVKAAESRRGQPIPPPHSRPRSEASSLYIDDNGVVQVIVGQEAWSTHGPAEPLTLLSARSRCTTSLGFCAARWRT